MGRKPKVSASALNNDLHIIRLNNNSIERLDKVGKGSNGKVYYTVDKDGVYHVVDTRGSKCSEMNFNSSDELMKYYNNL